MIPEEVARYLHRSLSWVYKNWQVLGGRKLRGSIFFPKKENLYERLFSKEERVEVRLHPGRGKVFEQLVQDQSRGQGGRGEKKGGHLTPRKVPMTQRLFEVLSRRHEKRDKEKPWVFWQRYWGRKKKERYFRFHALRHLGASILDHANVNIGSIQRILGHENRTTTEIYLHSIGESEREAMAIFEKVSHDSHTEAKKELGQFG